MGIAEIRREKMCPLPPNPGHVTVTSFSEMSNITIIQLSYTLQNSIFLSFILELVFKQKKQVLRVTSGDFPKCCVSTTMLINVSGLLLS